MKNCIDMPIFHTAICAEASQICSCMHKPKLHSQFCLRNSSAKKRFGMEDYYENTDVCKTMYKRNVA